MSTTRDDLLSEVDSVLGELEGSGATSPPASVPAPQGDKDFLNDIDSVISEVDSESSEDQIRDELWKESLRAFETRSLVGKIITVNGILLQSTFNAMFDAVFNLPQQALFKAIKGESPRRIVRDSISDFKSSPTALALQAVPEAFNALLIGAEPGQAEELRQTLGRITHPRPREDFEETLKESTVSMAPFVMRDSSPEEIARVAASPVTLALSAMATPYARITGNNEPTLGEVVQDYDSGFLAGLRRVGLELASRVPEDIEFTVPTGKGRRTVPGVEGRERKVNLQDILLKSPEALGKGALGTAYLAGDVFVDPWVIDMIFPPEIVATAGGKILQKSLRGAHKVVSSGARRGAQIKGSIAEATRAFKAERLSDATIYPEVVRPQGPGRIVSESFEDVSQYAEYTILETQKIKAQNVFEGVALPDAISTEEEIRAALTMLRESTKPKALPPEEYKKLFPQGKFTAEDFAKLSDPSPDVPLPPAGMQVEGLPQGFVTLGPDTSPLSQEQVFAGVFRRKVSGPRVGPPQRQLFLVDSEKIGLGFTSDAFEGPLVNGPPVFLPTGTLVAEVVDVDRMTLGREFIEEGRIPQDLHRELLGLYRAVEVFDSNTGLEQAFLKPIAARGGRPVTVFPEGAVSSEKLESVVSEKLRKLELETPLFHHTTPSNAISILADGVITPSKTSEFRFPTVSFTRQDASRRPRFGAKIQGLLPQPEEGAFPAPFFGGVRFVSSNETLGEKTIKIGEFGEFEERVRRPVKVEKILRLDIDPSGFIKGGTQELMRTLVAAAESHGIPTYIRPLFMQNEIQAFRPFVESSHFQEKLFRGPDTVEQASKLFTATATARPTIDEAGNLITSAEVAAANIENLPLIMSTDYPGKYYVETLGITPSKGIQRVPSQGEILKKAFDQDSELFQAMFPDLRPIYLDWGTPPMKGKGGKVPPLDDLPPDARVLPEFIDPGYTYRDLGLWGSFIDEPVDALSKLDHPHAQQILDLVDGSLFEQRMWLQSMSDRLVGLEEFGKKNYRKYSRLFFDLADTHPEDVAFKQMFKAIARDEKSEFVRLRAIFDDGWDLMDRRGVLAKEGNPKKISGYATRVFPERDFERGTIPPELVNEYMTGNVMFHHLKHRTGAEGFERDIFSALRAYLTGVSRKVFLEPALEDVLRLARHPTFPPNARVYVEDWVAALKGRPATLERVVRAARHAAARMGVGGQIANALGDAGAKLTLGISHALYRGFLMGSPHFYLQNFLTQGVLNNLALEGPYKTMRGIARVLDDSWKGVAPNPALMGGFKAMFEDLPVGTNKLTRALMLNEKTSPGVIAWRKLFKTIEEDTIGVPAIELQMRGIAFNIGAAQEMERLGAQLGRRIDPKSLADGSLTPQQTMRILRAGTKTSDNVNFVYGVQGNNPRLRQFFGAKVIGVMMQLMSYYGKELSFLYRNARKRFRTDPGFILRYFIWMGIMDRLLGLAGASGEDINVLEETAQIGERFTRFGQLPLGPIPNLVAMAVRLANEEDPKETERLWREFFRTSTGSVPLLLQVQRMIHLMEQQDMQTRISPYSDETLGKLDPKEIPALMFGFKTISDEKRDQVLRMVRNVNRAEAARLGDLAKQWMNAKTLEEQREVEENARHFGLDFTPQLEARFKRLAFSKIFRAIDGSKKNFPVSLIIDNLRKEMPEVFDASQADRLRRILQEREERFGNNFESELDSVLRELKEEEALK